MNWKILAATAVVSLVTFVGLPAQAMVVDQQDGLTTSEGPVDCHLEYTSVRRDFSDTLRVLKVRGGLYCNEEGTYFYRSFTAVRSPFAILRDSQLDSQNGSGAFRMLVFCNWREAGEWAFPKRHFTVQLDGLVRMANDIDASTSIIVTPSWKC